MYIYVCVCTYIYDVENNFYFIHPHFLFIVIRFTYVSVTSDVN